MQGDGLQSGGSYNGYQQAFQTVAAGLGAIIGGIAANRTVEDLRIDYDDVVVESTNVDNQQLFIAIAAILLLGAAVYLVIKAFRK